MQTRSGQRVLDEFYSGKENEMQEDYKTIPENGYPFWLYDPSNLGMMYFRDEAKRDLAAEEVISSYIDEFWDEKYVRQVSCGIVTHFAQCLDKEMRPNDIDEEGFSNNGTYWKEDIEWMGQYMMHPVSMKIES